ncbi:MAG: methyltransferase domain-containing protein [Nitrospirae bacterium]|nr:methyltransferase domain-containing protein [Nitrospirota bacterium]
MSSPPSDKDFQAVLDDHLKWWGLRRFESDEAYFRWQRQTLSAGDLAELNRLAEQKRSAGEIAETAFYDRTAHPHILPVLYSQRYDYYMAVGTAVAERIAGQIADLRASASAAGPTLSVLDVGCGVGILTTFYARQFPEIAFVGIDRSEASLTAARQQAEALKLTNVRFECCDVQQAAISGSYDLVISTHALLQSEQDPGIPSRDWQTFDRTRDSAVQTNFEARTWLGPRLDHVCTALAPGGRLILFEKTRQLARRVPFQRALAARSFRLCEPPAPIRYQVVEEVSDDGPLYVLRRRYDPPIFCKEGQGEVEDKGGTAWDEQPEPIEAAEWVRCSGSAVELVRERLVQRHSTGVDSPDDAPLYENHSASAQSVWSDLPQRSVLRDKTWNETTGYQMHVELGTAAEFVYLYQATNFDQRQLVVMEQARGSLLEDYYRELVEGTQQTGPGGQEPFARSALRVVPTNGS